MYIIAMNPLHMGMNANPLYGGRNDGYKILNRKNGEETQIGSKGFADDTAAITKSRKGLERMAEWVNEFCVVNRVSMNETKSLLFGIDKHGKDLKKSIEIVKQGRIEGPPETHTVVKKMEQPTPGSR